MMSRKEYCDYDQRQHRIDKDDYGETNDGLDVESVAAQKIADARWLHEYKMAQIREQVAE